MKRILAALFLALVVALVVASGVASAAPPHNFTAGAGKVMTNASDTRTTVEKFAFIAFSARAIGSTTEARNGHFVYHYTTTTPSRTFRFELEGSINCVLWSGNHAAFSGLIKKSTSSPNLGDLEGKHAFFAVTDNDSIGTPDQFGFFGIDTRRCPSVGFGGLPPITRGNILVSNAAQ